ncbi:MAG: hypothetical protein K9M51_00580 [Candidatus Gracilibacteria bacterium]|nr:hypothetical protein [Candidatus Gracilibacteria bacterium]
MKTAKQNVIGRLISIERLSYFSAILSMSLFCFFVFNSFWGLLMHLSLWLILITNLLIVCMFFTMMNGRLSYCLKLLKLCASWILKKDEERGCEILNHWSSFSKHWSYLKGNVFAVFFSLIFFIVKISFLSEKELWDIPMFFLDEYFPEWILYVIGVLWGFFSLLGAIRFKTRYEEVRHVLKEDRGYIKEEMGKFVGNQFLRNSIPDQVRNDKK